MSYLINFWMAIQTNQLDIPLQLFGSVAVTLVSYFIISKAAKPKDKASKYFTALYAFSVSETVIIIRKILQFFIDFFAGTNLMQAHTLPDDHWFFRVFGFGMSPLDQRPVFDMGEDFLLGTLGTLLTAIGLFVYAGIRNRSTDKKPKLSFTERCSRKYSAEMQKLRQQTNICDIMLWWIVRALMLHAFITMENRAEATLLLVNFLGTVAITVIHIIAPSDSFLGRINYRIQTLLTIMVFIGSYCGNYVFLYNIISRYDLFLHFVSGAIAVTAGYYIARVFVSAGNKKENILIVLFAFSFSLMIIPVHEMIEFIGDFIWGTSNQGFYWGPADDSFFFKLFGHGAGNTQLYYLFDTMYDALLASSSTLVMALTLYGFVKHDRKNSTIKGNKTDSEKQTVTC